MKNFYIFSFLLIVLLLFPGCKNKNEPVSDESEINPDYNIEISFNVRKLDPRGFNPLFTADAHRKYLNDPLKFYDLPDGGVPEGPNAVVGSDVCVFYPVDNITSDTDLSKLPAGERIPFTTIIQLGERLENNKPEWNNMFFFQDNYNYFYKTVWQGRNGVVFGADLYGIGMSNEINRINSLLYKYDGSFENFFPIAGYELLNQDIYDELESIGIAFQEVKTNEYRLNLDNPDDMISLYSSLINKPTLSIFVTTDLAAHASHLVFSRLIQYLEEEYFFPQMIKLTDEYVKAIEQKKGQIPDNIYNTSLFYFQTAQALLALAPDKEEDRYYYGRGENDYRVMGMKYIDVDAAKVLANYPRQVVSEIEKMNVGAGFSRSSIFNFEEDFSQYKPRGHYTKNGVLGAYFRALMWYGRINFNLGDEGNTRDLAMLLAPTALFITDLTENSPEIKNLWKSLFDPITELIGISDDISFYELAPLWNQVKGAGFNSWYSEPGRLQRFITRDFRQLRTPSISSSSLFIGPYAGGEDPSERRPPVGWRLFGQRYTLDSEIHHHFSPPRFLPPSDDLPVRDMVRGLDVMKVLGSRTADWLLSVSDYPLYPGLQERMNYLQRDLGNLNNDYWFSTYYTNVLYNIKALALFENGTGFYFTEKPGWNLKAMNAAHGTWAELRHATLLYVNQSYGESGGGEPMQPTFRTRPLPEPVHYIEPNIPFWDSSAASYKKIYEILERYDYLDQRTAQSLERLQYVFSKAARISRLQAEDKEVSREDIKWISQIAREFTFLVMRHVRGNVTDVNELRMALVVDVYTNAEAGMVLETAVGIPYRIYVPLNDGQGGKRIAMGYSFSYYEFNQPMSKRLNNDEWKAMVYDEEFDMSEYLPFWMQGRVLNAR
ncbi:MAG: DUF3160 domain-containing protein [Treponema sp.]|nr:DUF3160 domain-containing protein [Treponema sp.]